MNTDIVAYARNVYMTSCANDSKGQLHQRHLNCHLANDQTT